QDGTIIDFGAYLPYGLDKDINALLQTSAYKFTDQEQDDGTGLYNYDVRLYDPVIGQFIMADTIVPDLYNPQSLNRYAYCLNNPVRYVDPTGHYIDDNGRGNDFTRERSQKEVDRDRGRRGEDRERNNFLNAINKNYQSIKAGLSKPKAKSQPVAKAMVAAVAIPANGYLVQSTGPTVLEIFLASPITFIAGLSSAIVLGLPNTMGDGTRPAFESSGTEDGALDSCPAEPPEGSVENPDREGSFGEYDQDGRFKEKWRLDKGRPDIKRGHGSVDHIHIDGSKKWYPVGGK
ncbi:MAG: RHS repeat-associated core domain-containing protein, partial [bacterium]|nr:RHS repeat-associated core domain-containing protein [bacterium]